IMTTRPAVSLFLFLLMGTLKASAQSVSFDLVTNPTVEFTFNTMNKYQNGIIILSVVTLNVVATGTKWNLYVGSSATAAVIWTNIQYYSSTGDGSPPVSLLQFAIRNTSNTPQITGYVPMQDLATTTLDVIGNHNTAPNPAVNCGDVVHQGTNTPGTYLTDPQ